MDKCKDLDVVSLQIVYVYIYRVMGICVDTVIECSHVYISMNI